MNAYVIRGNIVTDTDVLEKHFLTIQDGRIENISADEPYGRYSRVETDEDCVVLPGFRDPHTHDLSGQMSSTQQSEDAIAERFETVMRAYAANGVTAVYTATVGAPVEELVHYCNGAKRWLDHPENGQTGTRFMGMNIEGSFINDECRGAQPAEFCFMPHKMDCIDAVNRLHQSGSVGMINIVPDYGDASLETIKHARSLGIMVGSGHLKPDADLLQRAIDECGLQYMVHFTNGPTGQSFKPFGGGNAFEGAMNAPIVKELILDLTHIDGRYVLDMIHRNDERWGEDKSIAITDALFPVEEEVPAGEFEIGTTVAMRDESFNCLRTVAYIQPDGSRKPAAPNQLCGSILRMNQAFANLVGLFTQNIEGIWYYHPAKPLEDAIIKTAKLCATNQAKLDGNFINNGRLAVGKQADLSIGKLEHTNGNYTFNVQQTWVNGKCVYSA